MCRMWDVRACRGCLAVKGKLEKISDGCKRLYTALTGLQIAECDGYPHYFCLECRTMVRKCLAFRRKSRRAHFVMKEIMSVRKQVTYSDIITVDRKKTNLNSSLGFWEPQKTCSIVITENDETEPDVEPTGPYNTRVVDIKPEIDTFEEDEATPTEEVNYEPDDTENDVADDINIKEELLDIDLNDVFKDLNDNDDIDDDDDAVPSPEPEVKDEKVKEEVDDIMSQKVNKIPIQTIVLTLEACNVRVLNLYEQKKIMQIKKISEEFAHALYKCAMCLSVHKTMEALVEHVAYHNSRRFDHECQVCRNKYPTVESLNIHVARCHMYEYTCKCNAKRHSLYEIVKHNRVCGHLRQLKLKEENARRQRAEADRHPRPLECFTVLALTQTMMQRMDELRDRRRRRPYTQPDVITKNCCKCDICGKWLKHKDNMQSHMTARHRFLYTCTICREVFTERLPAVKHGRTHREHSKLYPCKDCDANFKDFKSLMGHIKKHETKNTCNLCGGLFKSKKGYYKHQLTKHKYISLNDPLVGDPQYQCGDCGIQFVDKRSLERHVVIMNHTGASDVEFACVPCKKLFENEEQMETHHITCKKPSKYPRKCCYCPEMLQNKNHYQRHYNTAHPMLQYRYSTQNAICDICGKSIHKPNLEAHLKLHAGNSYYCRHCGASNAFAAAHVTHMLGHYSKPYCCALCPRRFQHKGDARDHILKVHAPTKLYKCEFCAQEFSFFRNLRDHSEKLHNLVIPTTKNLCKKSNSKVFVYAHMKIEINVEERQVLEKTDVCLIDYLDQKFKPVDYKDYFIFAEACDQMLRVKKKDSRTKKPKLKIPKVEIESDIIIKPCDDDEDLNLKYEDADVTMKEETENAVRGIADEARESQDMVVDEERQLEVFEDEGNQFVMIGGELYRIAVDDE